MLGGIHCRSTVGSHLFRGVMNTTTAFVGLRALLVPAFLAVLTGCSAQQPDLTAMDLPMEYSTDQDSHPGLLGNCHGEESG